MRGNVCEELKCELKKNSKPIKIKKEGRKKNKITAKLLERRTLSEKKIAGKEINKYSQEQEWVTNKIKWSKEKEKKIDDNENNLVS